MATKAWIGGTTGSETDGGTASNWCPSCLPEAGDTLVFNASSTADCAWDSSLAFAAINVASGFSHTAKLTTTTATAISTGGQSVYNDGTDIAVGGSADLFPAESDVLAGQDFALGIAEGSFTGIRDHTGNSYSSGVWDGSYRQEGGILVDGTFYATGICRGGSNYYASGILDSGNSYHSAGIFDEDGDYQSSGIWDGSAYHATGIQGLGGYDAGGVIDENGNCETGAGIWDGSAYHLTGIVASDGYHDGGILDGSGSCNSYGILDNFNYFHAAGLITDDGYIQPIGVWEPSAGFHISGAVAGGFYYSASFYLDNQGGGTIPPIVVAGDNVVHFSGILNGNGTYSELTSDNCASFISTDKSGATCIIDGSADLTVQGTDFTGAIIGTTGAVTTFTSFAGIDASNTVYADAGLILDGSGTYAATGIYDGSSINASGILDGNGTFNSTGILDGEAAYHAYGILEAYSLIYRGYSGVVDQSGVWNPTGIFDANGTFHLCGYLSNVDSTYQVPALVDPIGLFCGTTGIMDSTGHGYSAGIVDDSGAYSATGIFDGTASHSSGLFDGSGNYHSSVGLATSDVKDDVNYCDENGPQTGTLAAEGMRMAKIGA